MGDELRLMADVSAWLAARGFGPGDLTEALVERLMAERRASGRSRLLTSRALSPLLGYLRGLGVVPAVVGVASTPSEELVERYSSYLLERRGLAPSTVRNYVGVARVFLAWWETTAGGLCLGKLDAAAVSEFCWRRRDARASARRSAWSPGCGRCCGCEMSTGARARSRSVARAVVRSVCRCLPMWARRWRAGWRAAVRVASRCSCSPACARPMTACLLALSRRSSAARAGGPGCRWSALTGCGTRPRPRCSAPAGP